MKEPIALLINDIHIDKDNIVEFNKNWNEALEICVHKSIGDIVVGGDIFTARASHTLSELLTVKHAIDKAIKNDIYLTIAEGNHDLVNQEEIEGYNHLWCGLMGVDIVDTYKVLQWEDCDFVLAVMSYFPEKGSFLTKLDEMLRDVFEHYGSIVKDKSNIILYLHEGIHGALGDFDIEGELPQEPLVGFKSVLCGHYHNRVKIKGTNIEYIGSSRQANFGEDEEKGYTILYSDGSTEFIKNVVNTRYMTLDVNYDDIDLDKLEGYCGTDDMQGYKIRIRVKCTEKQAKMFDKQPLLDLGFNKVEMVSEKPIVKDTAASGIDEKYDKQGIKKEYQNFCNEQNIDSQLGIKYLEG